MFVLMYQESVAELCTTNVLIACICLYWRLYYVVITASFSYLGKSKVRINACRSSINTMF